MLDPRHRAALDSKLLGLADDEFILGHRNSEWTGHGPILEEDIAFANLALDELGHGILWYRIVAHLRGEDPETYPDKLVYERAAGEFQNVDVVALPHADWAFSMLRQFLFDAYESVHVPTLLASNYRPIAEAATKIKQEEVYHLYHTRAWVQRLGLGTDESRRRLQTALAQLWAPFQQLFAPGADESLLVDAGITPDLRPVHGKWCDAVVPFLESSGLVVPDAGIVPDVRRPANLERMTALIGELQEVSRIAPGAVW
jgi:ring-1,2-phenylacetyl-CoA epoxidase subunit PaaC